MDSILSYGEKFMNDQDNQEEKIERQKKFLSILGDVNFQDRWTSRHKKVAALSTGRGTKDIETSVMEAQLAKC